MNIIIIIVMTFMGALASIFFKKASGSISVFSIIKSPSLYIGGILYLIAAILNIIVLKSMNYSIVMPLTSLTYIWTILLAKIFMAERLSTNKILGCVLICVGATLIAF